MICHEIKSRCLTYQKSVSRVFTSVSYPVTAWKAGGGQTGNVKAALNVQVPLSVSVPQMVMPASNQPLMPYTLNAAMMGASGFVHAEPVPEGSVSVEPVGGAAPEVEGAAEEAVPVQLHQMQQDGVVGSMAPGGAQAQELSQSQTGEEFAAPTGMGNSMMAQMQSILASPGGASAAAQYQVAAQLPTAVQQAPVQALAQPQSAGNGAGGIVPGQALADPWGAFTAFQSSASRR